MKKRDKLNFWVIFLGVVFLLIGFLIYVTIPSTTFINKMAYKIIPLPQNKLDGAFFNTVRGYLPDACWSCSLTLILSVGCKQAVAVIIAVAFGTLWEFAQLLGVFSGTFDLLDIFTYFVSALLAYAIIYFIKRRLK